MISVEYAIIAALLVAIVYLVTTTNSKVNNLVERIDNAVGGRKAGTPRVPRTMPQAPAAAARPQQQMMQQQMPQQQMPQQQQQMQQPMANPAMMGRRAMGGAVPDMGSIHNSLNMGTN